MKISNACLRKLYASVKNEWGMDVNISHQFWNKKLVMGKLVSIHICRYTSIPIAQLHFANSTHQQYLCSYIICIFHQHVICWLRLLSSAHKVWMNFPSWTIYLYMERVGYFSVILASCGFWSPFKNEIPITVILSKLYHILQVIYSLKYCSS